MRLLGHLDLRQQPHRSLRPLARRVHIAEVHWQHHVLDDRERRQQLAELEDEPRLRPRQAAIWPSLSVWTGTAPTITSPDVGRSMPVTMLIRVDLPLPDLPMIATNWPRSICRSTRLSARKLPAALS